MKHLHLILILTIIGYCFTDSEVVDCEALFEEQIKQKCLELDNCVYNENDANNRCVEVHECSDGNEDSNACRKINPRGGQDYSKYKCKLTGSTCGPTLKTCSDYITNGIIGNNCSSLSATDPSKQRCILSDSSSTPCKEHFNKCEMVTSITSNTNNECTKNIPEEKDKQCIWDNSDGTYSCKGEPRYCGEGTDEFYVGYFGNVCKDLTVNPTSPDASKKTCIYDNSGCKEEYKSCEERPSSDCNHWELKDNSYDYTQKCIFDSYNNKCKKEAVKFVDYNSRDISERIALLNEEFCGKLNVTKVYKRCAYNEIDKICYEEYDGCDKYNIPNIIETDRKGCEKIVLRDKNKKCFYNEIKDKCEEKQTISKCEDYEGGDKKICESIISSETGQYCILEKDSNCTEKPINCTEAKDEDDCLHIAKASDSNKRCAYDSSRDPKCFEEYIRCEDYIQGSDSGSSLCEDIILYDGKTCKWDTDITPPRCLSNFKTCDIAETEEECKLIEKTGVSNPDRKICAWDSSIDRCKEVYKYCSDYRRDDRPTCEKIKPYDISGNNLDIGYKCKYDLNIGCQKTQVECSDANNKPILCELYSSYIKDNNKKHCVYNINTGECTSHFRKCEDWEYTSEVTSCSANIIEDYIEGACIDEGKGCKAKDTCSKFSSTILTNNYRTLLCHSIHPNCTYKFYDSDISGKDFYRCEYKENNCTGIKFYSNDTKFKDTCELMEASKPYKKCVLKADQSGCEEVYKDLDFSTANNSYSTPPDTSNQGNSSGFIKKGIHLIIAFLYLLI